MVWTPRGVLFNRIQQRPVLSGSQLMLSSPSFVFTTLQFKHVSRISTFTVCIKYLYLHRTALLGDITSAQVQALSLPDTTEYIKSTGALWSEQQCSQFQQYITS